MRIELILLVLLLSGGDLMAQPQLALLRKDHVITRFKEGEQIRFKRKEEKGFTKALITGIYSGYFMLGEDTIYHHEIAKIDVSKKTITSFKVSPMGKGLIIAGVSLLLIDVFNTTAIQHDSYQLTDGVRNASLILVGLGTLAQVVNNNYFKPGRRKKLASLNL